LFIRVRGALPRAEWCGAWGGAWGLRGAGLVAWGLRGAGLVARDWWRGIGGAGAERCGASRGLGGPALSGAALSGVGLSAVTMWRAWWPATAVPSRTVGPDRLAHRVDHDSCEGRGIDPPCGLVYRRFRPSFLGPFRRSAGPPGGPFDRRNLRPKPSLSQPLKTQDVVVTWGTQPLHLAPAGHSVEIRLKPVRRLWTGCGRGAPPRFRRSRGRSDARR